MWASTQSAGQDAIDVAARVGARLVEELRDGRIAVQNIWRHADATPENVALREDGRTWTYRELRSGVARAAAELEKRAGSAH